MVFGSVLPVGFLQLETAFTASYDAARSLAFYERPLVQALFWARLPGDAMLIGGTVLFAVDVVRKLVSDQREPTAPEAHRERVPARFVGEDD
jgi:nitric oxide reductase subunit B